MRFLLVSVSALALSGCGTMSGSDAAAVLEQLGKNYGHCERHLSYSAGIGIISPGATLSGSISCPPLLPTPLPLPDT